MGWNGSSDLLWCSALIIQALWYQLAILLLEMTFWLLNILLATLRRIGGSLSYWISLVWITSGSLDHIALLEHGCLLVCWTHFIDKRSTLNLIILAILRGTHWSKRVFADALRSRMWYQLLVYGDAHLSSHVTNTLQIAIRMLIGVGISLNKIGRRWSWRFPLSLVIVNWSRTRLQHTIWILARRICQTSIVLF